MGGSSRKLPAVRRYGLLALLTIQYTMAVLCLRYSRTHKPDFENSRLLPNSDAADDVYIVSVLVLSMETMKLFISFLILIVQMSGSIEGTVQLLYRQVICRPSDTALLAVPGLFYIVQDNLVIYALSSLDAPTYTVTYQTRICMTALFARILLKKRLNSQHWVALLLLTAGVILTQLNVESRVSFRSETEGPSYFIGLLAATSAALISGFTGVYNEKVMKNGQQPYFLVRSIQLNLFAVLFAVLTVLVADGDKVRELGLFHGFGSFIWFTAFVQSFGGIIVAATIKFADSILKTFATSISIVLSCIISYSIFGDLYLSFTFVLGTAIIILSTFIYSRASSYSTVASYQQKFDDNIKINVESSRIRD